ncbi:hypothetical protein [Okeania sp. KiyG1]|uniref:hypothetical protein n=1 Tax=Okeania sp. KiyG1 TaxID=2720165 RepID=UPI001924A06D|nr:hypothetical protein [Okeania sp. KiyG1]
MSKSFSSSTGISGSSVVIAVIVAKVSDSWELAGETHNVRVQAITVRQNTCH